MTEIEQIIHMLKKTDEFVVEKFNELNRTYPRVNHLAKHSEDPVARAYWTGRSESDLRNCALIAQIGMYTGHILKELRCLERKPPQPLKLVVNNDQKKTGQQPGTL